MSGFNGGLFKHITLELPPSRLPEPQYDELDGTWGLIDLSWSQRAPQMQLDDIDRNLRYSQYLYQEADKYEEDEDMEVDEQVPSKTGSARMAAPTSIRHSYHCLEATYAYPRQDQTPGSPHSIHTNTDLAMEMGSGRSETHRVIPHMEALLEQTRMLSAPDLVSSITKSMTAAATDILEKFTHPPLVDDEADAVSRSVSNKEGLWPPGLYQLEWKPQAGCLNSTDLDTGCKLPTRRRNGNLGLK